MRFPENAQHSPDDSDLRATLIELSTCSSAALGTCLESSAELCVLAMFEALSMRERPMRNVPEVQLDNGSNVALIDGRVIHASRCVSLNRNQNLINFNANFI